MKIFELGPLMVAFKTAYLYRKLAFSPDCRYVALTGRQENEPAFVWEIASGKLTRPPLAGVSFFEFIGPQGYLLMSGKTAVWDVPRNQSSRPPLVPAPETAPDGVVRQPYFDFCIDVSRDGRRVLGAPLFNEDYEYTGLGLWELATGRLEKRFATPPVKFNNARVSFGPDEKWFTHVAQCRQEDRHLTITTWEVESGKALLGQPQTLPVSDREEFNFEISNDGLLLMAADRFYRLDPQQGARPVETGADFGTATGPGPARATSRKLLSGQELLEILPEGVMTALDPAGQVLARLPLSFKAGGTSRVLEPRVVGAGRDYWAAADDHFLLLWERA